MKQRYKVMIHRGWYYVYRLTEQDTWKRLDNTASRSYDEALEKTPGK